MTDIKSLIAPPSPAVVGEVPEDVRKLAESYAGRMVETLLGTGPDPDFIAILSDAIMADRASRPPVVADGWKDASRARELALVLRQIFESPYSTSELQEAANLLEHFAAMLAVAPSPSSEGAAPDAHHPA